MKPTVGLWLKSEIDPERIERIVLPNNYIEYRIWSISSIAYDGRIVSFGKRCTAKYLATPDDLDLVFDETMYIKDEDNEYFTEDEPFYEKITGITNIHRFIGKTGEDIFGTN